MTHPIADQPGMNWIVYDQCCNAVPLFIFALEVTRGNGEREANRYLPFTLPRYMIAVIKKDKVISVLLEKRKYFKLLLEILHRDGG